MIVMYQSFILHGHHFSITFQSMDQGGFVGGFARPGADHRLCIAQWGHPAMQRWGRGEAWMGAGLFLGHHLIIYHHFSISMPLFPWDYLYCMYMIIYIYMCVHMYDMIGITFGIMRGRLISGSTFDARLSTFFVKPCLAEEFLCLARSRQTTPNMFLNFERSTSKSCPMIIT